jgi:hypothetical protein
MTRYFTIAAAAALLASPALAQSNSSNLETQRDVLEGARQSQRPLGPVYGGPMYEGAPAYYEGGPVYEGRGSAIGGTNHSNLETREDVLRGAEESARPGPYWGD